MDGWWAASYIVLWVVVGVLCVTVVALARQVGTLHLRLGPRGALELDEEGPPLGDRLAPAQLLDTAKRPVTIGATGEPQLLLFVSPGCSLCRDVMPAVSSVARHMGLAGYLLADAKAADAGRIGDATGLGAPLVPAAELARAYGVPGTPFALVTDADGVLRAKGTVNSMEQVEGLALTARRRLEQAREVEMQARAA